MNDQRFRILSEFKAKFDKDYPNLKYSINSCSITVPKISTTGFDVTFEVMRSKYIIHFDTWHEQFDKEADAGNCFVWGLSNETRLKVFSKWGFDYKWIAEMLDDGKWMDQGETGLIFYPYWAPQKVRILQNDHVKLKK